MRCAAAAPLCLGVTLALLSAGLGGSICFAQSYRCDWSVVGQGGGGMSGTACRAGVTAGQAAAGMMTGARYSAYTGFWQANTPVGILEERGPTLPETPLTRLEQATPNPFRANTTIRYSLAHDGPVSLCVRDITGRVVREFAAPGAKRGASGVTWDGRDEAGRKLAGGVYFCRLSAGETVQTERLVLVR